MTPAASAAAMTSESRIEPPGWTTARTPAPVRISSPSAKGKKASEAATAPALRLRDLAEEPWIYGASGPWRDITIATCAQAGFVPEQAHVASDWRAILDMVAAGMGVALIPRLAATNDAPGVALRTPHADQPRRHVVTAVRSGAGERPQIAVALRALAETAADLATTNVQIK